MSSGRSGSTMNPNPFLSLNHFTVPLAIMLLLLGNLQRQGASARVLVAKYLTTVKRSYAFLVRFSATAFALDRKMASRRIPAPFHMSKKLSRSSQHPQPEVARNARASTDEVAAVAVIMGSKSDWETMRHSLEVLQQLGIACEARVVSAHRTPDL